MEIASIVSEFLPPADVSEVRRDNIIEAIDHEFANGIDVVWLYGADGSGKTSCLRQFAQKHCDDAVAVFASNQSRWTMDWEMIRMDLCDQVLSLVDQKRLPEGEEVSDVYLNSLMLKLIRHCRRRRSPIYFIIDGTEDIPTERLYIRDLLFETLPFNIANCKFIISCEGVPPPSGVKVGLQTTFPTIPFTSAECQNFLGNIIHDVSLVDEIRKTSKGHPGHLAAIRRILAGKSCEQQIDLIRHLPEELPRLFDIEWRNQNIRDEWLEFALAILANERRVFVSELAVYLGREKDELVKRLSEIKFLELSPEQECFAFVSESFRSYVEKRLIGLKSKVSDTIIGNLLLRPDDDVTLKSLPKYLAVAGRNEELIDYLSGERISQILARNESCSAVIKKTELAIKSAVMLSRDGDVLRLAALNSVLVEAEGLDGWRAEVEAYITLGNYSRALAFAQGARLKEHRLRMLAVVVRKLAEERKDIPPELVAQIRGLYASIEKESVADCALELASDLICATPEIAVELVESSKPDGTQEANDIALARMSLMVPDESLAPGVSDRPALVQRIRDRIQDGEIRTISESAQILFGGYSVEKVLSEIARLEKSSEQLYLLRSWLRFNGRNENAWRISEAGLNLIVKADVSPNASILADLAKPIEHCTDWTLRLQIITTFDAQKSYAERVGPSADFVRLQLHLAAAEFSHDRSSAVRRILDSYFFSANLADLSTRLLCYAYLEEFLSRFPSVEEIQREGVVEILSIEISKGVDALLAATADHYAALTPLLKRIARYDPERAYSYCSRLNTPSRRSQAKCDVAIACLPKTPKAYKSVWMKVCDDSKGLRIWDSLIFDTLACLADPDRWEDGYDAIFKRIEGILPTITNSDKRCFACCIVLNLYENVGGQPTAGNRENVIRILRSTWEGIDQVWLKVESAYKIAAALGTKSRRF
jgi:hypothetical protein